MVFKIKDLIIIQPTIVDITKHQKHKVQIQYVSLLELINNMTWPSGSTCATQEPDGEILFWSAPIEDVSLIRKTTQGMDSLVPKLGMDNVVAAMHFDPNNHFLAIDWQKAVITQKRSTYDWYK